MLSNQEIQIIITLMLGFVKDFKPKSFAGHTPEETAELNLRGICYELCALLKLPIDSIKVDQIVSGFESRGEINKGVFTYRISATLEGSVYKYKIEHRCFL